MYHVQSPPPRFPPLGRPPCGVRWSRCNWSPSAYPRFLQSAHRDDKVAVGNCLFECRCRATLMGSVGWLKFYSPSNFREAQVRKGIGGRIATLRVDPIKWVSWNPSVVYLLSSAEAWSRACPGPLSRRNLGLMCMALCGGRRKCFRPWTSCIVSGKSHGFTHATLRHVMSDSRCMLTK